MDSAFVLHDARLTPSRIEKAGKRLAQDTATDEDFAIIAAFQGHITRATADLYGTICRIVANEWTEATQITARSRKTLPSIRRKILREKTRLQAMQDLAGCRIVSTSQLASDYLCGIVQGAFEGEVRYRSGSRTGYRAIHYILGRAGIPYEVQIRTDVEDAWAQLAESLDVRYPGVKYGNGPREIVDLLRDLADAVHAFDERRDELIHEAAGDDRDVHPARIPEVRLARRPIETLFAALERLA